MGGYRGKQTAVDDCRCLNINRMVKLGAIPQCGWQTGNWIWTDKETGEQKSAISYEADTRDPYNAFLRIHYTLTDRDKKIDYKIRLSRTEAHYGGGRWWFICPSKGKRVAKLYLPSGGEIFASRHAYRLKYASQSECPGSRANNKMWKLKNKLGGYDFFPQRPKGMHETTFERLVNKADEAEEVADYYFLRRWEGLVGLEFDSEGRLKTPL
ncbi:MAG: hypothetical protein HY052_03555 [Proteobacteria bacterium]|nr:hypothetical protein [Pseudomonadota bacterium]